MLPSVVSFFRDGVDVDEVRLDPVAPKVRPQRRVEILGVLGDERRECG
jgi:hypothetical protein